MTKSVRQTRQVVLNWIPDSDDSDEEEQAEKQEPQLSKESLRMRSLELMDPAEKAQAADCLAEELHI